MQVHIFPEQYPELKVETSVHPLEGKSDLLVLLVPEERFQDAGELHDFKGASSLFL